MKSQYSSYSTSSSETSSSEKLILLESERPKKIAGRRIFKETRHPVYRGIRKRNNNKWVCEMRVPNKSTRIWLGTYPTPEMAARAHDVAALSLRGKSALLNFADSAWRLPLPASTDVKEIRKIATEAALAFVVEDHSNQELVEDGSDKNLALAFGEKGGKGLCVEVPGVSLFEDWFRSMSDEPLRSPITPLIRYDWDQDHHWNNVDLEVDDEVSLWTFTL